MNRAFGFALLGVPVHVTWSAVLVLGIVAFASAGEGRSASAWAEGVVWAGVLFFSVLVHEGGHVLAGRLLRLRPRAVVLHGFGGVTVQSVAPRPGPGILLSVAGPLAGFALAGAAGLAGALLPAGTPPGVGMTLGWFLAVNLVWSAFNLLPMHPLDGGGVLRNALALVLGPERAWRITRIVSIGVAVPVGLAGLAAGLWFVPLVAVLVVLENLHR